jgi:hypothetical protein
MAVQQSSDRIAAASMGREGVMKNAIPTVGEIVSLVATLRGNYSRRHTGD